MGAGRPPRAGVTAIDLPVTVSLLDADPDLGEGLGTDARRLVADAVRVRVFRVARGSWNPPDIDAGATGLIVLEGLMVRTLRLGGVSSAEVVGPTDVIRPWENDLIPSLAPGLAEWRVLEEARVALLDGRTTALLGRWPEISAAVAGRLLRRSRSLAYLMAAQHFLKVQDRLLATLWHLASMWGRVTPQGIVVPFRLTHEMLAQIVGAQRSSVTVALQSLTRENRVTRDSQRRYVLRGEAPDWSRASPPTAAIEV